MALAASAPLVGGDLRAATVDAPGARPRLGAMTLPARRAETTLVEVVAAPRNPLDPLNAFGELHSARHEEPDVPGSECVGVVLGSECSEPGMRVHAECHASPATPGTFATQVVATRTFGLEELPAAWQLQPAAPHTQCVILPNEHQLGLPVDTRQSADRRSQGVQT